VLGGADVAVWVGERAEDASAAAWFVLEAHARGVPVVGPRCGLGGELHPGPAGACLAQNATSPELSRVLLPLVEDAAARRAMSQAVRTRAAELGRPERLVRSAMRLWQSREGGAVAGWTRGSGLEQSVA
jgi:hypothetical protein